MSSLINHLVPDLVDKPDYKFLLALLIERLSHCHDEHRRDKDLSQAERQAYGAADIKLRDSHEDSGGAQPYNPEDNAVYRRNTSSISPRSTGKFILQLIYN